jgi:arylsulfatase A-like enzyme
MTHKNSVHEKASYLVLSGHEPIATVHHPSLGAVIAKELGARNELPTYISIPGMTGLWEGSGVIPARFAPFETGDPNDPKFSVRDISLPMNVDWARMNGRNSLLSLVDSEFRRYDASGIFETVDSFQKTAHDLVASPLTKKAFAIQDEPEKVRERYGRTSLGQGALLARRLVQNGVRFVTVSNGYYKWDHHAKVFENLADKYLPELDRAFSALIEDLDQSGMLATTLVVMTGEFGRTPEVNVNAGRDHWPNVFSLVLAGAGVPGGHVWGESDKEGAQVKDKPVEVADLIATIYQKVGIDYQKEYVSNIGRPFKLAEGKPLPFLS